MGLLLERGRFERHHVAALRIESTKDTPDGAVLAATIECLQHDQYGVATVCVELVLQFVQTLQIFLRGMLGRGPIPPETSPSGGIRQARHTPRREPQRCDDLATLDGIHGPLRAVSAG